MQNNTYFTLQNKLKLLKEAVADVERCNSKLLSAKTSEEFNEAFSLLDDPYKTRIFLESTGITTLKNAKNKKVFDATDSLKTLLESLQDDSGDTNVNPVCKHLLENLLANGFKIEIEIKPNTRTDIQGKSQVEEPKLPNKEEEDPDFKEYNEFLAVLNEYQEMGEAYFYKGIDEAVVKDTATAANMKKKQFDSYVDNTFNKMLNDFREAKKQETHDKLCKRSIKLSKVLTHLIILFPLYAINPAFAALSVIIPVIINKHTDSIYRTQMLNELKTEERIIDEKIKDADALGDKGKKDKIKLMRLKDKVAADADRIEKGWI